MSETDLASRSLKSPIHVFIKIILNIQDPEFSVLKAGGSFSEHFLGREILRNGQVFRRISRILDPAFLGDEARDGVGFSVKGGLVVNGYSESEDSVLWSQAIGNDQVK